MLKIKIKVGKNTWLKVLFIACIAIAIFGEVKADDTRPLYYFADLIDRMRVKYLLEVIAIICGLVVCYADPEKRKLPNIKMLYETKNILLMCGIIGVITVGYQLMNGFYMDSYVELFQWVCPMLFVFVMVNVFDDDFEMIFDIAFYLTVFQYFYYMGGRFTLENFKKIDFFNSFSPFEGIFAFYTCIMISYFLFANKRIKAFICMFITIMSFKRIAIITSIVLFVFYGFMHKNKRVNPILLNTVKVIFILIPFVLVAICNEDLARWIYSTFNINIYRFTLGRFDMIMYLLESDGMKYGLGSTIKALNEGFSYVVDSGVDHVSLHNDHMKIYLETTIIGTISFVWFNFNIAKKCNAAFIIMLYMFVDMLFNHLTGSGSVTMWILVYLSIYYFNKESENPEQSVSSRHRKIKFIFNK